MRSELEALSDYGDLHAEPVALGRHVLILYVERVAASTVEPQEQETTYSGFVLSVGSEWYWGSAGHVVTELKEAARHGYRIAVSRFFDLGLKYHMGFNAHFNVDDVEYIDDRQSG